MIQKTLKTLTGKIVVTIPGTLQELKLGQLMAMQAAEHLDDLQAIHILSGVPIAELNQVQSFADLHVFNEHVLTLATQIKELYNSDAIPKTITFTINQTVKKVKVINNLSVEPAGAFMASRDIIADEISRHINEHGDADWKNTFNPSLKTCSQVLAHYFYNKVTGLPYDEQQAAEFTKHIEELPVADALPIAKYFFLNYPNLSKPRTSFWHRLHQFWNSALAYASLKVSATSTQLMRLPEEI
jgi:hypothetical protein